jgi:hemoglobin
MPPSREFLLVYTRRNIEEATTTTATPPPTSTGRDVDDVDQIAELVRRFYGDVAQDDVLGPIFVDVAQVDWSEHLPKLTAFWSRALLGTPGYAGNPFRAHARDPLAPVVRAHALPALARPVRGEPRPPVARPERRPRAQLARDVASVHSRQILGRAVGDSTPTTQGDRP